MWKKLLALAAVCAGPLTPRAWAWGNDQPPMPSSVLRAYKSSAADPGGFGGSGLNFSDPIYAAPLPSRRVRVPAGGPLVAPVITPVLGSHGRLKYEVIKPGQEDCPIWTKCPQDVLVDPCERLWFGTEFLYWATRGATAPPLITTGPVAAGFGLAANLGQPTTGVLFGGSRTLTDMRPGFRLDTGLWLDPGNRWAIAGRFYFLGSQSEGFAGIGTGLNVLNAPQVASIGGASVPVPIYAGFPGLTRGTASSSLHTNFLGGDVALRRNLCGSVPARLDVFGGYRYLHLGDALNRDFGVASAAGVPLLLGEDSVRTRNNFHGADLGLMTTLRGGAFSLEVRSSVALGVTVTDVDTSRTRVLGLGAAGLALPAGVPAVLGIPAQTGGRSSGSDFAVVPEVGVKLGWQPTTHMRLTAGYTLLYWSSVRRAEGLFDLSPAVRDATTDVWAQGFSLGAELRY